MKSPITEKEMSLMKRNEIVKFRGEDFEIISHYFFDEENGLEFTTNELDELNINQVYNKYREKHRIPFPAELIAWRNRYNFSSSKMAEILGFGTNTYRLYETGDMPTVANARLLNLVNDPSEFVKLIEQSDIADKRGLITRLSKPLIKEETTEEWCICETEEHILGDKRPSKFNGYTTPNFDKLINVIVFITNKLPNIVITKMNKLLFYSDFVHYKRNGFSITGCKYQAIQWGPVPRRYDQIFDKAQEREQVVIVSEFWDDGKEKFQFIPHEKAIFDETLFRPSEFETLSQVIDILGNKTTNELIDISHLERAWTENVQSRSLISYEYGFDLIAM